MHSPSLPRVASLGFRAIRWIKWPLVFAVIIQLCIYANDVHTRKTFMPSCKWNAIEAEFWPPDARLQYSGRVCYLTWGTILLQIHDATGRHLLVERMYSYPKGESARLFWALDYSYLGYDTRSDAVDDGVIYLPPSLLDRLRARLP